jgi:hypothetical protein
MPLELLSPERDRSCDKVNGAAGPRKPVRLTPRAPAIRLRIVTEPTYGPERVERLVELLRALAIRILELDDAALLAAGPALLKLLGDARSELFHYEVRSTYDTPQIAEHRRIVREAQGGGASPDDKDEGDA